MTDEERSRELTRSSFAAQMAMLGYEPNGNPKDMVEVVRCKDCKYYPNGDGSTKWLPCREIITPPCWFCADGRKKDAET